MLDAKCKVMNEKGEGEWVSLPILDDSLEKRADLRVIEFTDGNSYINCYKENVTLEQCDTLVSDWEAMEDNNSYDSEKVQAIMEYDVASFKGLNDWLYGKEKEDVMFFQGMDMQDVMQEELETGDVPEWVRRYVDFDQWEYDRSCNGYNETNLGVIIL